MARDIFVVSGAGINYKKKFSITESLYDRHKNRYNNSTFSAIMIINCAYRKENRDNQLKYYKKTENAVNFSNDKLNSAQIEEKIKIREQKLQSV